MSDKSTRLKVSKVEQNTETHEETFTHLPSFLLHVDKVLHKLVFKKLFSTKTSGDTTSTEESV